jgi:hypothetical protein
MKSGNLNFLEPPGPLQACNGTALLFTYFNTSFKNRKKNRRTEERVQRRNERKEERMKNILFPGRDEERDRFYGFKASLVRPADTSSMK